MRTLCFAEYTLLHNFKVKHAETFKEGAEVMIKINQFIWIGSDFHSLYLKALKDILEMEIKTDDKPSEIANLIKKSLETHSLETAVA